MNISETQNYFRNVHLTHRLLKEKGSYMPQIPNETLLNLQVAAKLQHLFRDLEENTKKVLTNIGKLTDNIKLYREARIFFEKIKTFRAALDKIQGDSYNLSDAVHIWY